MYTTNNTIDRRFAIGINKNVIYVNTSKITIYDHMDLSLSPYKDVLYFPSISIMPITILYKIYNEMTLEAIPNKKINPLKGMDKPRRFNTYRIAV